MSVRPYLSIGGHLAEGVDAMFAAWFKPVTLQVALWIRPTFPICCEVGRDWSERTIRTHPPDGTLVVVHQ
jgi:hypothetical protein